jgi:hypothetical protein
MLGVAALADAEGLAPGVALAAEAVVGLADAEGAGAVDPVQPAATTTTASAAAAPNQARIRGTRRLLVE